MNLLILLKNNRYKYKKEIALSWSYPCGQCYTDRENQKYIKCDCNGANDRKLNQILIIR